MRSSILLIVLLVVVIGLILFQPIVSMGGDDWSISGLNYRAKIIIRTPGLNTTVTDLPIPLSITNDIIDFSKTSPSGDDIIVTDMEGRVIPFYVEYWNVSEGKGVIWIRPRVYNGSMELYIYYNMTETTALPANYSSPWNDYFLALLFNQRELFFVKEKPYIRDEAKGNHTAKIVGPGYTIVKAPTGEAIYLDGENAWIMISNTTFYNWSSTTIEVLLHLYDKQARYGRHRDLSYGNYITAPFASMYILYGENKTNPNITLYFNTWRPGTGRREYTVNLTKYRGEWIYLVITYDNVTREYGVYVNGEKIYEATIPEDEMTIVDVNPHKWDPYGSRYLTLGLGANNIGFERTRVAYDFIRILKDRVVSGEWVRAEYLAITNTSVELVGVEENKAGAPVSISIPKTLVFGIALVLIVSAAYMVYNRRRS